MIILATLEKYPKKKRTDSDIQGLSDKHLPENNLWQK